MVNNKPCILTLTNYYLPGYKAGGPIRTLANMTGRLGDEFQFKIITADRDFGDTKPYSEINSDGWNKVGKADVFYTRPDQHTLKDFRKLLGSTEYNVLYLNSFFSPYFTIKPLLLRRLRLIPDRALVIAPRGEFSTGALALKSFKKQVYIVVAKTLGLYKDVIWQASSKHEEADIRRCFGSDVRVLIAPDLPPLYNAENEPKAVQNKTKGYLKILFLSRISQMKNLDFALKMLAGLKGKVEFNIYGPMEDKVYWAQCQKIISVLPENIKVRYCASVEHNKVGAVMREHDIFLFPTLGENFGHVILEALLAGCPVLISDQTPWRNLQENNVGWDLPLSKLEMFQQVLQRCIDMDNEEYMKWSDAARAYGLGVTTDDEVVEQNRQLFNDAVAQFVQN